jgi:hypothetical protein
MGEPMRCLSTKQPWIGAIILRDKRTENRGWPAPPRIIGKDIALHSSRKPDWDAPLYAWDAAGMVPPWMAGITQASWCRDHAAVLGAVLAVGAVAGCHHASNAAECRCDRWAAVGQYHWVLDGVRTLPAAVSCGGALRLWPLPEDVEKLVRAQLGEDGNHG